MTDILIRVIKLGTSLKKKRKKRKDNDKYRTDKHVNIFILVKLFSFLTLKKYLTTHSTLHLNFFVQYIIDIIKHFKISIFEIKLKFMYNKNLNF